MKLKLSCVALCMGAMLAGCDTPAPVSAEGAAPSAGLSAVTYAFARAMEQAEVRGAVRDAMRASPVSEHKLVLQDYVQTQSGRYVLEQAARAAGTTPQALLAEIGKLPAMDFYVGTREQRLSWQGSASVAVVGTLQDDAPVMAGFDARGRAVQQRGRERTSLEAVFLLHPAENKHLRVHPQGNEPGLAIQEEHDGEWAGALEETDAAGRTTRTEYVDMIPGGRLPLPRADEPRSIGPAYVITSGPGTFFTALDIQENDAGDCELALKSDIRDAWNNTTGTNATHTATGVRCPGMHYWETRFPPQGRRGASFTPAFPNSIRVRVYEDDTFANDYAGENTWKPEESGAFKPLIKSKTCDFYGQNCTYIVGGSLAVKFYY